MTKSLHALIATACIAGGAFCSYAQPTEPVFQWGNLLTGMVGQDQTRGIATYGTDAVYWMAHNGSANGDLDVTYGGTLLYNGAEYEGTSANKNLTILKTNAAGEEQWVIHSEAGDFITNEGSVAVDKDGNLVIFGAVRHTDLKYENGINIIDAKGNKTELGWNVGDRRNVRLFLATATPEGEILWARSYDVSTAPAPKADGTRADFTADAVNAYALALDAENNIYIGGRYRNPLYFPKANGETVTLNPKNVSTWNGDAQQTTGDLYVVKLDAEGNYLAHLEETGDEVGVTYTWDLAEKDGYIYLSGYAKGEGTIKLGGVSLTSNQYVCPIVAKLDKDLKPEWAELLPGGAVGGKNAVQSVGMTVSKSNIWLAGMYNGTISSPSNEADLVQSTQGNIREGFIIKLDAADGSWLGGANSRSEFNQNYLTGYLRVIDEDATQNNEIMVYGYAMNATAGIFLRSYNAETLVGEPDKSWSVITGGGVPTAIDIAYVPELATAYMTVRGNKAFTPMGGEASEAISGYTNYLSRFDLPAPIQTSQVNIEEETSEAVYYNLQGLRVDEPTAPGLYIRRQGAKTEKILVK